mmetsp:Transcript_52073/g.167557  ORF Transcript_52073/g.167557 Transcript_52073/m.167557 type:complete len:219 (+) Transcript_52073:324-980(+)
MSSGRDFYITSLGMSPAIARDESWVVFHNPGQGGTRCESVSAHGLTRTDCLSHFLRHIREQFDSIVVVGFSAGGMPSMSLAQEEQPIADAFISVCSPDRIRLVFEDQASWWLRVDVFFAVWFHLCMRAGGWFELVPFKNFPWPPTWEGYMKPFSVRSFEIATGRHRSFEELEAEHFDGSLRMPPKVWWEKSGGHCGQFYWSPDCAQRLREWVLRACKK